MEFYFTPTHKRTYSKLQFEFEQQSFVFPNPIPATFFVQIKYLKEVGKQSQSMWQFILLLTY